MDGVVHRIPPTAHRAQALRFATGIGTLDARGQRDRAVHCCYDVGDRDRGQVAVQPVTAPCAALRRHQIARSQASSTPWRRWVPECRWPPRSPGRSERHPSRTAARAPPRHSRSVSTAGAWRTNPRFLSVADKSVNRTVSVLIASDGVPKRGRQGVRKGSLWRFDDASRHESGSPACGKGFVFIPTARTGALARQCPVHNPARRA